MQIGDQVGDYRLVREVGRGSFGVVYQAEQVYLGTQAAIKVLVDTAPEEREELLVEALKIAAWRHPHITLVLGFSPHQGFPYLVLQYAPHGTLKERYPPGQAFSIDTILPHVQQIAEGLQYTHERKTLHLDLKPANVLLDEQQAALISDFGISVILQPTRTHLTVRTFMGTPAYAAPEQFDEERGHATSASDQYALATMVYQWLTGRLPFEGASIVPLATQKGLRRPAAAGRGRAASSGGSGAARAGERPARALSFATRLRGGAPGGKECVGRRSIRSGPTALRARRNPICSRRASCPPMGTLLLTWKEHASVVYTVVWSPVGHVLASGDEGAISLWDAGRGQLWVTLSGHTNRVLSLAWSPDGRLASASADNTVRIWDAGSGRQLAILRGHTGVVNGVAWSPDGRRLASASWDKTVRLWDTARGQLLATLSGHTGPVKAVAWSPRWPPSRICWRRSDRTPLGYQAWPAAGDLFLPYQRGQHGGLVP